MSYQQLEVNYVGKHFENNQELLIFLLEKKAITQELADSWSEDIEDNERITNLLDPADILIPNFPSLQDVDSISGDGGMFLGYVINTDLVSKAEFDNNVQKAQLNWKTIFNEHAQLNWLVQYI